MPRACTVCNHPDRKAIETALVAGEACRVISASFRVSEDALQRHKSEHLPAKLSKAKAAREVANADDLLIQVKALQSKAASLLLQAESAGDLKTALVGVRESRGCIELLAKLMGQLDERPTVNITLAPQWVETRTLIINALAPYPDARIAVATALENQQ